MAHELLGGDFDIHGGGNDLIFPHHENEIAQSKCAHPGSAFAQVWMHNEMLQVEGKKMSKSLGNFFTVRDLLDKGISGDVVRFVFLSTHYRKPMDWTDRKRQEAEKRLTAWYRKTDGVEAAKTVPARVLDAIADDLNTHLALTEMNSLSAPYLKAAMRLIGLPDAEDVEWFRERETQMVGANASGEQAALGPLLQRWQALREARDYGAADDLKGQLEETGLKLSVIGGEPHAEVLPEFDSSKLEALK